MSSAGRWRLGLLASALAFLAVPQAGECQQSEVKVFVVPPAEVKWSVPLSSIVGVRALSDGRLLVVDGIELKVLISDPGRARFTQRGRVGEGPGEYRMPIGVIPWVGDSTAVVDGALSRLLILGPDGGPGRVVDRRGRAGNQPQPRAQLPLARYADGRGRLYGTGASGARGFLPIVRWQPDGSGPDTVARIAAGAAPVAAMGPVPGPFATWPQWAVAGDGTVAVVSPEPYLVELWRDGRLLHRNGPIMVAPEALGPAERREWLAEQQRPVASVYLARGSRRTEVRIGPGPAPTGALTWPRVLPVFLPGALLVDPRGRVWIKRESRAPSAVVYDVFDTIARHTARVQLPSRHARIVGFSAGQIIISSRDQDDLEWLSVHRGIP